jgi:KUP system potassium uptake protein
MGAYNLAKHPEILGAVNPLYAARYVLKFPRATLYVVGSVDLCITGCEALYADMGHFSRPAVRRAWYVIVWPALALNYLGQGSRLLDPTPIVDGNVFYALVPSTPAFVYPLVLVSWLATVIASQALISGAFSLVNQAIQLGLCPRVRVVHTNEAMEGQIYIPAVNWLYLAGCIFLVVVFKSSHNLAPAYGLAVTGTMAFTTVLFFMVATRVWKWNAVAIGAVCLGLILVDIAFFLSNAIQFFEGGYITILIAAAVAFVMLTWRTGRAALGAVLLRAALPVDLFLGSLKEERPARVKGTAVFMTSNPGVPPSLTHYFKHAKTLHETVILLTVHTKHVPTVPDAERVDEVSHFGEGMHGVSVAYGFMDTPDIPRVLGDLGGRGIDLDLNDVSYFLGRETLVFTGASKMTLPRKAIFKVMSQNAVAASAFFKLPPGRVVELGMQVEI